MEKSSSSTIDEKLRRTAHDVSSACQTLGLDDDKKKKVNMEEKVKAWVSKVNGLSQRFSKLISSVEQKLPGFKRSMAQDLFQKLKSGLCKCRETKEAVRDELEDLKTPKATQEEQAEQVTLLQQLHNTLGEHMQALQEACAKNEKPPADESHIKAEELSTAHADEQASE